jgi:hypothetical protein
MVMFNVGITHNTTYNGVIPAKAGIQSLVFKDGGICLVDAGSVIPDLIRDRQAGI